MSWGLGVVWKALGLGWFLLAEAACLLTHVNQYLPVCLIGKLLEVLGSLERRGFNPAGFQVLCVSFKSWGQAGSFSKVDQLAFSCKK